MFVVVFVISIPLAWVGYSLHWIRERRQFLSENHTGLQYPRDFLEEEKSAPAGLWLFGEVGWHGIVVKSEDCARAKSLFPEAEVVAR
jgi:hypothetical protein